MEYNEHQHEHHNQTHPDLDLQQIYSQPRFSDQAQGQFQGKRLHLRIIGEVRGLQYLLLRKMTVCPELEIDTKAHKVIHQTYPMAAAEPSRGDVICLVLLFQNPMLLSGLRT